ncbi:MAG TPA: hypothetical protein VHJ37_06925 [Thermoleophilaceae bacterium]|nr:hypothetical protein [Thermoleophilaceae bacterium]
MRTSLSVVLAVVGALLLPFAAAALYARERVVDPEHFADRALEALDEPAVRRAVEREIVVGVQNRFGAVRAEAAAKVLRPRIEAVIASQQFRRVFRAAALETNRRFFVEEQTNATVDLEAAGPIVRAEVRSVSPRLARQVPRRLDVQLITLRRDEIWGASLLTADDLRLLGVLLALLTVAAFMAVIAVARSRARALIVVGMATAVAAAALGVGLALGREVVVTRLENEGRLTEAELEDAAGALFDVYLNDLYAWALVLGVAGVVLVVSGWALARVRR